MSHIDGYREVYGLRYAVQYECPECGALVLVEGIKKHQIFHTWRAK